MQNSDIPYRKQETDFYCAPAVIQMIIAGQGIEISQSEVAAALGTNEQGTPVAEVERLLGKYGFAVVRKNDATWEDMQKALEEELTVVVGFVEPGEEKAHYAIVTALSDDEIRYIDPWHGPDEVLARDEFLMRWRDDEDGAYGERMMLTVSDY